MNRVFNALREAHKDSSKFLAFGSIGKCELVKMQTSKEGSDREIKPEANEEFHRVIITDTDDEDEDFFPKSRQERVKKLRETLSRSKIRHEIEIMKLHTLKDAHVYCVYHNLSAQHYGPLLEKFIRTKFNYSKNKAKDATGDCNKDGKNFELKVSLGGAKLSKFNFVQIRPSHDCGTYVLTAYHLSFENVEDEGDLFIFRVSKEEMKKLVLAYGGYAHGTIKEHGKITMESLNDDKGNKEYALRPTINDRCWKALISFRVSHSLL